MAQILIAEDDEDVCFAVRRVLRRAGFSVLTAGDGSSGLELARAHELDLVLTDLDMPVMDGLQLCQAIRADPRLADIPVALMSGSLHPGDPRTAEAMACAALLKPFGNDGLVVAVQQLIRHGRHDHTPPASSCPRVAADSDSVPAA